MRFTLKVSNMGASPSKICDIKRNNSRMRFTYWELSIKKWHCLFFKKYALHISQYNYLNDLGTSLVLPDQSQITPDQSQLHLKSQNLKSITNNRSISSKVSGTCAGWNQEYSRWISSSPTLIGGICCCAF